MVARTHKTLIWERTRQVQRLRHQLREYFPAALEAFEDLDAPDALELLGKAPDPARAAKLTRAQVSAGAQARPPPRHRRTRPTRSWPRCAASSSAQPPPLTAAYAATVRSLTAVITTLNEQVKVLRGQVEAHFGQHPDAEIYLSQPGMGAIPGARVLGEFGDDPHRYAGAKARKNYAATCPVTRASGKKKIVAARFIRNDRLIDALMAQAFAALSVSPGARAFYDDQRARGHRTQRRPAAGSPTGWSASCTDASRPAPSTTRQPPGPTGKTSLNLTRRLTSKLLGYLAGRPDQGQAQVLAGEELLGLLPGQALAGDDGGAGRLPVRGLVFQDLPGWPRARR